MNFKFLKPPITLYVDPVGACNMKCPTCPRGRDEIELKHSITWELYVKILDKAQS